MRTIITDTTEREALYDISSEIKDIVAESGVQTGLVHIYTQHTTAAIVIQEDWNNTVPRDMVNFMHRLIPVGCWEHDRHDGNGDAHLKAGIIGSSETIPIIDGKIGLGKWQNIFLCEFDGPRQGREVIITIIDVGK